MINNWFTNALQSPRGKKDQKTKQSWYGSDSSHDLTSGVLVASFTSKSNGVRPGRREI